MARTFAEALENRRSYYAINNQSPITDNQIQKLIDFAIDYVPSAFNSQSTRVVLLLGQHHQKLWSIVKETLKKMVPADKFGPTDSKINAFAAGYGSVLFFEDEAVVEKLQKDFALYADNFPVWSHHTSAMHQLTIWTMLEDAGFGASLQHYNPIIDDEARSTWSLDSKWKLIAQMPFGGIVEGPGAKEMQPIDSRRKIFK